MLLLLLYLINNQCWLNTTFHRRLHHLLIILIHPLNWTILQLSPMAAWHLLQDAAFLWIPMHQHSVPAAASPFALLEVQCHKCGMIQGAEQDVCEWCCNLADTIVSNCANCNDEISGNTGRESDLLDPGVVVDAPGDYIGYMSKLSHFVETIFVSLFYVLGRAIESFLATLGKGFYWIQGGDILSCIATFSSYFPASTWASKCKCTWHCSCGLLWSFADCIMVIFTWNPGNILWNFAIQLIGKRKLYNWRNQYSRWKRDLNLKMGPWLWRTQLLFLVTIEAYIFGTMLGINFKDTFRAMAIVSKLTLMGLCNQTWFIFLMVISSIAALGHYLGWLFADYGVHIHNEGSISEPSFPHEPSPRLQRRVGFGHACMCALVLYLLLYGTGGLPDSQDVSEVAYGPPLSPMTHDVNAGNTSRAATVVGKGSGFKPVNKELAQMCCTNVHQTHSWQYQHSCHMMAGSRSNGQALATNSCYSWIVTGWISHKNIILYAVMYVCVCVFVCICVCIYLHTYIYM